MKLHTDIAATRTYELRDSDLKSPQKLEQFAVSLTVGDLIYIPPHDPAGSVKVREASVELDEDSVIAHPQRAVPADVTALSWLLRKRGRVLRDEGAYYFAVIASDRP